MGVTMFVDGKATTRAATGRLVYEVDNYQYALGDGPCLSTVGDGQVHEILDMAESSRWLEFCHHANQRGIRSSISFPLLVRDRALGALNFYSSQAGAFSAVDRGVLGAFAAQAAVALANAEAYAASVALAAQLGEALVSRGVIDQAKGILMAQQCWDEDQAFEALKAISSRRNAKIRDVAAEIVGALKATEGHTAGIRPE